MLWSGHKQAQDSVGSSSQARGGHTRTRCSTRSGCPFIHPCFTSTFRLGVKDDWVAPLAPGPLEGGARVGPCPHLQLVACAVVELQGEEKDASGIL